VHLSRQKINVRLGKLRAQLPTPPISSHHIWHPQHHVKRHCEHHLVLFRPKSQNKYLVVLLFPNSKFVSSTWAHNSHTIFISLFEENWRKHLHMPCLANVSIAIIFHVSFELNMFWHF
jgi:hypothetical protein